MKKQRCMMTIVLALLMIPSSCFPLQAALTGSPESKTDRFDNMFQKIRNMTLGDGSPNYDEYYMTRNMEMALRTVKNTNQTGYWDTLQKGGDNRAYLWKGYTNASSDTEINALYGRIFYMVKVYAIQGDANPKNIAYNSLYHNADLKRDIIGALDWMYANRYNENMSRSENWYNYEIAIPLTLQGILFALYPDLTQAQVQKYLRPVLAFSGDPNILSDGRIAYSANRIEKCYIVAQSGLLLKDSGMLELARDAMSDRTNTATSRHGANSIFSYRESGDGMYRDGTLIQHSNITYNGSYGVTLLYTLSKMMYILNDSPWALNDPEALNVYQWVYDAYEPILYKGQLMDMFRGRAIAYKDSHTYYMGYRVIQALMLLSDSAPALHRDRIRQMIKEWLTTDEYDKFKSNSIGQSYYIEMANQILSDDSIAPREEKFLSKVFSSGDRVVHVQPDYAFGVSMSSSRIAWYSGMNRENMHGWHTGDGMTYLYNGDFMQYMEDYWPTIDPYRLPGTTVDKTPLEDSAKSGQTTGQAWTGGVSDRRYSISGMQLAGITDESTKAKKSWFLFDNEIVALGADIQSQTDYDVETIIDNRRISPGKNQANQFYVDGEAQSVSLMAGETVHQGVQWMAQESPDASIGYYFPDRADVHSLRELRDGRWADIRAGAVTDTVSNVFLTNWIDHGVRPGADTYAYAVLPGAGQAAMAEYAESPDFTILENSSEAQAACKDTLQITGINFWQNKQKTVGIVTSWQMASLLYEIEGEYLTLTVTDPTQLNTTGIDLALDVAADRIDSADPRITDIQLGSVIRLHVNTDKLKGTAVRITLHLTQDEPDIGDGTDPSTPSATPEITPSPTPMDDLSINGTEKPDPKPTPTPTEKSPAPTEKPKGSVAIQGSALVTARKGASVQFNAVVTGIDGSDAILSWSSSDSTVAFINQNGLATALKAGSVVITVQTASGLSHSVALRITA